MTEQATKKSARKSTRKTDGQTPPSGQAETLGFQTEVKQLLHLMIHSLYSNKDIFLRELISNASDACDKLRFEAVSNPKLLDDDSELAIRIEFDKTAGTITVTDNGIGMSRAEVIDHLGTIAKSGTGEFLAQLSGDERKDASLIGQFGVGFYSSFVVADRVDVFSRRAGLDASTGVHWSSQGEGEFSVESIERPERGTSVVLHLRKDDLEFADAWKLRSLVRRYSDHISFPSRCASSQSLRPVTRPMPNRPKRSQLSRQSTPRVLSGPGRAPISAMKNTKNSTNTFLTISRILCCGVTIKSKASVNTQVSSICPQRLLLTSGIVRHQRE